MILERIFDIIMELDKLKEDQPAPDLEEDVAQWSVVILVHTAPTHFDTGRNSTLPPHTGCMRL